MKLNKIQQVIAGAVIMVLAVLLAHFVFLKKSRAEIQRVETHIKKLEMDINVAKAIMKTAHELQDEMIHLKAQLERLKKILPEFINQPKFLADVKRYANENGIEILDLTHSRPVVDDVIVEHPYGFTTRGNYHDFGNFFAQLTNYHRIVNVKGLQLMRNADSKDYSVETYFVLSVFTYREPSEEEVRKQIEEEKKIARGATSKTGKKRR